MSDLLPPAETAPRTASAMNRIVASSLRQRFLVVLMTLVLIGAGSRSLERLPVDAYPDLSPPIVEIITQWPGHAAEEIERLITVPVEGGMNGVPRMATQRSISRTDCQTSSSLIKMARTTISPDRRSLIECRASACRRAVTPSMSPLSAPSGLVYRYVLQSPDRSPMQLKTFEDWIIEPAYKSLAGVADDSGFGGGTMQYQVMLDPTKIAGVGLSVLQVETALGANNGNAAWRLLFAGWPVLLRARPRAHGNDRGHQQRGARGA